MSPFLFPSSPSARKRTKTLTPHPAQAHDRLFLDALEHDLKRAKMHHAAVGELALSFAYDPKHTLYEQFSKVGGARR